MLYTTSEWLSNLNKKTSQPMQTSSERVNLTSCPCRTSHVWRLQSIRVSGSTTTDDCVDVWICGCVVLGLVNGAMAVQNRSRQSSRRKAALPLRTPKAALLRLLAPDAGRITVQMSVLFSILHIFLSVQDQAVSRGLLLHGKVAPMPRLGLQYRVLSGKRTSM